CQGAARLAAGVRRRTGGSLAAERLASHRRRRAKAAVRVDAGQAEGGTHKDPANEVWVFNPASKARVRRLRLVRPGSSIALSHGPTPLLLVQAGDRFDVYDPQYGNLIRSLELSRWNSTRMNIEPVH